MADAVNFTASSCGMGGTFGSYSSGGCSVATGPTVASGSNSITMTGSGTVGTNGSGLAVVDFDSIAPGAGFTPPYSFPVAWDFTVSDNNATATSGTYKLQYTFGGNTVAQELGSLNFVNGVAQVTGTDTANVSSFFNVNYMYLEVDVNMSNADLLTLTANSVQVQGTGDGAPGAPEPASMLLIGSGLIGVAYFRRRTHR